MTIQSKRLTEKGRFWRKHVRRWLRSNLTQIQYCNKHSLSVASFRWWRRQLREPNETEKSSSELSKGNPPFAELPVPIQLTSLGPSYDYEIDLSNQKRLRLNNNCDPELVAKLLTVLETTC